MWGVEDCSLIVSEGSYNFVLYGLGIFCPRGFYLQAENLKGSVVILISVKLQSEVAVETR